jgi:hypothetical protein
VLYDTFVRVSPHATNTLIAYTVLITGSLLYCHIYKKSYHTMDEEWVVLLDYIQICIGENYKNPLFWLLVVFYIEITAYANTL